MATWLSGVVTKLEALKASTRSNSLTKGVSPTLLAYKLELQMIECLTKKLLADCSFLEGCKLASGNKHWPFRIR